MRTHWRMRSCAESPTADQLNSALALTLVVLTAALTRAANYGSTPQQAVANVIYHAGSLSSVRTNHTARYAMVLSRGGRVEGELVHAPILVERFSFGWQALEIVNFSCRLRAHALSPRDENTLMAGMPSPQDDRPCSGVGKDGGPSRDVEAVRRVMRGPFVPWVVVNSNYALGSWYGAGGGQSLYRKSKGMWRLIISDGGAMGVEQMKQYGVPKAAWCPFGIFNAHCSSRHSY